MRLDNYINGQWTKAEAAASLDVLNPATEEVLAEVPLCGDAEIDAAARAGQVAFDGWRRRRRARGKWPSTAGVGRPSSTASSRSTS